MNKTSFDPTIFDETEYEEYVQLTKDNPGVAYQIRMGRKIDHLQRIYKSERAFIIYAMETTDSEALDAFAYFEPFCHLVLSNPNVNAEQLNDAFNETQSKKLKDKIKAHPSFVPGNLRKRRFPRHNEQKALEARVQIPEYFDGPIQLAFDFD